MHQTRALATTQLPLPRKGTKYLARALSHHRNSVPVVVAIRDMLKLALTAKEVKAMIRQKMLKINGRLVKDHRESLHLFNQLEAGKKYLLSILPTGKFTLKELSKPKDYLGKVIRKRLVNGGEIQLGLHDGFSLLTKDKSIKTGDSVYINSEGDITEHVILSKGNEVFIISGKHQGMTGKISSIEENMISVNYDGRMVKLDKQALIVLK